MKWDCRDGKSLSKLRIVPRLRRLRSTLNFLPRWILREMNKEIEETRWKPRRLWRIAQRPVTVETVSRRDTPTWKTFLALLTRFAPSETVLLGKFTVFLESFEIRTVLVRRLRGHPIVSARNVHSHRDSSVLLLGAVSSRFRSSDSRVPGGGHRKSFRLASVLSVLLHVIFIMPWDSKHTR